MKDKLLNKEFTIVNDQEGKRYDAINSAIFSPDIREFAYIVKEGNKEFVILNNIFLTTSEGKRYDKIYNLNFSSDSKYLVYGAKDGNDLWWVAEEIRLP